MNKKVDGLDPEAAAPKRACLTTLKARKEFLRVAQGIRCTERSLSLEVARAPQTRFPGEEVRFGVTASRKIGGAVERNRAKRRLRATAHSVLPLFALPGNDYVLVARQDTLTRPFAVLVADLASALDAAHARQRALESGESM